ncbi:Hypothetical protein NCS54_00715700 [Fusarium falciforme]|uniref:Hypothetical protein n=1 Tax=Fusarium falciforme TaxID=195108 RepID=UPI0023001BD5|nr:Hypothetical protein NCS54_00715700 [Fusarium falciforme]WAO89756.1 Hypothetical protein NCS54_00715700 [Fusarium falciforme]
MPFTASIPQFISCRGNVIVDMMSCPGFSSSSETMNQQEDIYSLTYNSDICKILLAIILPPVGVFLERGCGADFLINILLTILGYIPGIIHALYIILKY